MKIAATIVGSYQVSPDDYQTSRKTFIFDASQSIEEILRITGESDVSALNLANVIEARAALGGEEKNE